MPNIELRLIGYLFDYYRQQTHSNLFWEQICKNLHILTYIQMGSSLLKFTHVDLYTNDDLSMVFLNALYFDLYN